MRQKKTPSLLERFFLWSRFKLHSDLHFDFDYASVLSPTRRSRVSLTAGLLFKLASSRHSHQNVISIHILLRKKHSMTGTRRQRLQRHPFYEVKRYSGKRGDASWRQAPKKL